MNIQQTSDAFSTIASIDCDLAAEARLLRRADAFSTHGHRAKTLVRNGDLTVVLMALRHGTRIREQHVDHPATLMTLRGSVRVGLGPRTLVIATHHLLSLDPRTHYGLEALDDSDVLLIVGRPSGALPSPPA